MSIHWIKNATSITKVKKMDNNQRYRMAIQLLTETIALIQEDFIVNDLEDYITSLNNKIERTEPVEND